MFRTLAAAMLAGAIALPALAQPKTLTVAAYGGSWEQHLRKEVFPAFEAKHGVKVRVMIDGVGRYLDGHPDLSPLKKAGVEVAMFISPWIFPFSGKANLRNHRKSY